MLTSIKAYNIPIVFVVEKKMQEKAKGMVDNLGIKYSFADPGEVFNAISRTLG